MKQVLLITPEEAIERTSMDDNIDRNKIINTIIVAQDLTLEPLLGSVMFDEIKEQIIEDTLTDDYKTLLDYYCRKVLTSSILNKVNMFLIYRHNNTGVVKNEIDKQNVLSKTDIETLRGEIDEHTNVYSRRLTAFLEANLDKYPLYDDIVEGKQQAINAGNQAFYNPDSYENEHKKDRYGF